VVEAEALEAAPVAAASATVASAVKEQTEAPEDSLAEEERVAAKGGALVESV
jgi:hypothetical protein